MEGVITLSMEIELGWGVHDIEESAHLSDGGSRERAFLDRLLDHCDTLDLPITFDIVGHLLERTCSGDHDGPHPTGWFDSDPGTSATLDPLFYAPDIARKIRRRQTPHELCSHTYSHVPCREATPETVIWELERSKRTFEALTGNRPRSFVPPRHSRPASESLEAADIEIMRMCRDTNDGGRISRLQELVLGPHPVFEPALVEGIVETYCTSYPSLTSAALPAGQRPPSPPFRILPLRARQELQLEYLSRAVERAFEANRCCHLWCHLYDLSNEYQWPVVKTFLTELAATLEEDGCNLMTMHELNDHVRAVRTRVPAND